MERTSRLVHRARSSGSRIRSLACAGAVVGLAVTTAQPAVAATWTLTSTPHPARGDLEDVSCTSVNTCIAVGSKGSKSNGTLAERWNGHRWTIQPTPKPAVGAQFLGVSCTSANACTAVGSSEHFTATLAERWNGLQWKIQSTPSAAVGTLDGVSCTSTSACIASGFATGPVTLAERWNGLQWTIQSTPSPAGGDDQLGAVSCTSASACVALGSDASMTKPSVTTLAERWNGLQWTIQPIPNPAGGGQILAVSCTSANACIAVGHKGPALNRTLAERWNGLQWKIQSTPNPTAGGVFYGVSCTSANACIAVGYEPKNSHALAERWNGQQWTIQPTPDPARGPLEGVSCTSANACMAVGENNVAERYG